MPARATWKGFLQIRQLQVPVKAFGASSTQPEIRLNQLHRECGQRIRQFKACPTHGVVQASDLISGYEYADGSFMPVDDELLSSLRAVDRKSISVDCFVAEAAIDPLYHSGRTYYVVPDGPLGQRPFNVLKTGLQTSGKCAVSHIVLAGRELLVLLRPHQRLIALTVLEYPQRVRPAAEYEGEVADITPGKHEQQLALQLIDSLTDPEFDIHRYQDPYVDGLNHLIQQQLAEFNPPASETGEIQLASSAEEEAQLIEALKASLAQAGSESPLPGRVPSFTQRSTATEPEQPEQKSA